MNADLSELKISVTKPNRKPALMLAELGMEIVPIEEDEGNVDRYILSDQVAVERRTGSGLLQGIMDKTLFTSAVYLYEHFQVAVLIVEGEVDYTYTRFDPQAIRGALSSMPLQYGVSVLSTPSVEESVQLIAMMTRHAQVGVPEISLTPKRKAVDLPDMQRRVIEMLPGCGMVMARDLLQHFGSVKPIVNGSEEDFRTMRGIGAKKATEMHRVLNAEYESVDTEKNLEDAIEEDYSLLFDHSVELLARQHVIFAEGEDRHIVDLIFLEPEENSIVLVELKRMRLIGEHERQLQGYLNLVTHSDLLRDYLAQGMKVRGVLASIDPSLYYPRGKDVEIRVVDRQATIKVLKRLREQWDT
jgi:ERCC4-type nuclease